MKAGAVTESLPAPSAPVLIIEPDLPPLLPPLLLDAPATNTTEQLTTPTCTANRNGLTITGGATKIPLLPNFSPPTHQFQ